MHQTSSFAGYRSFTVTMQQDGECFNCDFTEASRTDAFYRANEEFPHADILGIYEVADND